MAIKKRNPKTGAEWQEAVNLAAGYRMIADAKMYGLITAPEIDVARCDYLLEQGEKRGVRPNQPAVHIAVGIVQAINAEAAKVNEERREHAKQSHFV